MPIYHDYAPFYDGSGQLRFAVLMAQYLAELLQRHPVTGRRALDLACGTGTLALDLADKGWDVVGLDGSAAMLELARAKAANLDTLGRVAFVRGDMRDFGTEDRRPRTKDQIRWTMDDRWTMAAARNGSSTRGAARNGPSM